MVRIPHAQHELTFSRYDRILWNYSEEVYTVAMRDLLQVSTTQAEGFQDLIHIIYSDWKESIGENNNKITRGYSYQHSALV